MFCRVDTHLIYGIYAIDLKQTNIIAGAPGQYSLDGGGSIYCSQRYAYIPKIVMISLNDMEELDGVLEMWDYWQPGLYETIMVVQASPTVSTNRNNQTYTAFGR